MTRATKAIKITEQAHYQLRIMAAKSRKPIWELVDQAVVLLGRKGVAVNGKQRTRKRRLCRNCHAQLTSADSEAGECTQCNRAI